MSTPERKRTRRISRRKLAAASFGAILVVFLILVLLQPFGSTAGPSRGFVVDYPRNWKPLPVAELSKQPGKPLLVLRRTSGVGYVVVRRQKPAPPKFAGLASSLTRELRKRVTGFHAIAARTIKVRAGRAFFFSYVDIENKRGTVHSVVVVPAADRSYELNTVSLGGADDVASEIAHIVSSFNID